MELIELYSQHRILAVNENTGNNSELEHADRRCGGQENIEEREQAGALVATRCTVSTVTDC